jgi:hypothetical protein
LEEVDVNGGIEAGMFDEVVLGGGPSFVDPGEDSRAGRRGDVVEDLGGVVDHVVGGAAREQGVEREQDEEDDEGGEQGGNEAGGIHGRIEEDRSICTAGEARGRRRVGEGREAKKEGREKCSAVRARRRGESSRSQANGDQKNGETAMAAGKKRFLGQKGAMAEEQV